MQHMNARRCIVRVTTKKTAVRRWEGGVGLDLVGAEWHRAFALWNVGGFVSCCCNLWPESAVVSEVINQKQKSLG